MWPYTVFVDNPSRDFGVKDPGGLEVYVITKTGLEPLAKVTGGIQIHDAFRELVGVVSLSRSCSSSTLCDYTFVRVTHTPCF